MSKSKYDEALYYYHLRGKCQGLVGVHVDDFMHGGTSHLQQRIMKKFREAINIGAENVPPLRYIGLNISQDTSEIIVDQHCYLSDIEKCEVNQKDRLRILNSDENHMYRLIVGQLNDEHSILPHMQPAVLYRVSL